MAEEKSSDVILEREYIVPLRKKWLKTPAHKRGPKAIKILKQFIAKHMKVEERDVNKVLIDKLLNEEIWFRGIRRPPAKIKVKAKKYSDGKVRVELSELPETLKWKAERLKKKEAKKTAEVKKPEAAAQQPEGAKPEGQSEEKKKEEKEKEKSMAEKENKDAKSKAKQEKHRTKEKKGIKKPLARKTLKK